MEGEGNEGGGSGSGSVCCLDGVIDLMLFLETFYSTFNMSLKVMIPWV